MRWNSFILIFTLMIVLTMSFVASENSPKISFHNRLIKPIDHTQDLIPIKKNTVEPRMGITGHVTLEILKPITTSTNFTNSTNQTESQLTTDSIYLIWTEKLITKEQTKNGKYKGVEFIEYIPTNAWIVKANIADLNFADYVYELRPEDKFLHGTLNYFDSSDLKGKSIPIKAVTTSGTIDEDMTLDQALVLANKKDTLYLTYYPPKKPLEDNFNSRNLISANYPQTMGYTGKGIVISTWDGGWVVNHTDFGNRFLGIGDFNTCSNNTADWWDVGDNGDGTYTYYCTYSNHATHVAGTAIGGGIVNALYKGIANESLLVSYEWAPAKAEFDTEFAQALNTYNMSISHNSWGYSPSTNPTAGNCNYWLGMYWEDSTWYDNATRGAYGNKFLTVFSAGNERGYGCPGVMGTSYNTTIMPGTAKNVLTVGAVDSNKAMTSFSSWGPTDDGRIKPEVVADGSNIESTQPGDSYASMSGTSMAAPAVSGAAAIIYQYYRDTRGTMPPPSFVKNILIHTAQDLGNVGPDYQYGFGLINITRAIMLGERDRNETLFYLNNISNSQSRTYTFEVNSSNLSGLKMTLLWNEYAGSYFASKELLNDLNLVVFGPNGTRYYPWTLDPANPSAPAIQTQMDDTNIVEQVYVASPDSGVWTVIVNGTSVPYGPQPYSLITDVNDNYAPRINLTSPSGNMNPGIISLSYTVTDLNLDSCWFTNITGQNQSLPGCGNISFFADNGNYTLKLFANDTYGQLSMTQTSITINDYETFALASGWNLISIPRNISNWSIESALSSIWSNLEIVWGYNATSGSWLSYDPDIPAQLNSLRVLEPGKGYWVELTSQSYLALNASVFNPQNKVSFESGWNLLGFPANSSVRVNNSVNGLDLNIVWGYDALAADGFEWASYTPGIPINSLNYFNLTKGYWFRANTAGNWTV